MTRFLAVSGVIGWLVAAPAHVAAQQTPETLVAVETLPPEPTVLTSGDAVKMTYRLRFPDLTDQGKEIVVLEDRMAAGALLVPPFEAVDLAVERRRAGAEHVWDFTYRLRLINAEKSNYTVPPIAISWLVHDFGEELEDAEVRQIETAAAVVRYVSTVTDIGRLDIRDTISLGEYRAVAATWRIVAWVVSPLPLLAWILYVGRLARRRPVADRREIAADDDRETELPVTLSVAAARRQLRPRIEALRAPAADDLTSPVAERDLVIGLRDYLHAELPELNAGDTPREIRRYVETNLALGPRRDALMVLAALLADYQRRLEHGTTLPPGDRSGDALAMETSLDSLRRHLQVWRRITQTFSR
jgi:hypothetical protein